jgi:hypothetical protein
MGDWDMSDVYCVKEEVQDVRSGETATLSVSA